MRVQLHGILTERDNHGYISHPFEIPPGATRIDIDFTYAPEYTGQYGNFLTLSLFDPHEERGSGMRHQSNQHIFLSASDATPGFTAGALHPGKWNALVNVHVVNPGATVSYDLNITVGFDTPASTTSKEWTPGFTAPRGAGWYRGDLHAHSLHSDASWDVGDLVNFARAQRLDFTTLSDHNTVSGLKQMASMATDDLLTMGGFELTTFFGHALALGMREVIDWRVRPDERIMSDIAREIEAAGGLFVIAHPRCPGDPICTGCRWEYDDVMPGDAHVVEVWNSYWDGESNNETAVALWYEWLNQGYRLTATVGTDNHGTQLREFGYNVVYAAALTERAILDGIRHGHLYLSSGPEVSFIGKLNSGASAMMGDTLQGDRATLDLSWSGCQDGDVVRLIVDGTVREEIAAAPTGSATWQVGGKHWCLVEIRDLQDNMRALTNPIYVTP